MFIEVRLEESQAEFIRDHFDSLRQEEMYKRNDSGSLVRAHKYDCIVGRFNDAFLEKQVRRIRSAKDGSRTSCASPEDSATRNTAEEREKQHTTGRVCHCRKVVPRPYQQAREITNSSGNSTLRPSVVRNAARKSRYYRAAVRACIVQAKAKTNDN